MIKTLHLRTQILDGVYPDLERLGADIQAAGTQLEAEGFEIISIIPVNQGHWTQNHVGYGYTTTQGVVITGRKPTES